MLLVIEGDECKEVKVSIGPQSVTKRIIWLRLTPAIAAATLLSSKNSFLRSKLEQRWKICQGGMSFWVFTSNNTSDQYGSCFSKNPLPPPSQPVSPLGHYDKAILHTSHNEIWCRHLVTWKFLIISKCGKILRRGGKNCSNFMKWLEDGVCEITGVQI